jgi:Coenzyme PQQ synthesis protein D (PqqD)
VLLIAGTRDRISRPLAKASRTQNGLGKSSTAPGEKLLAGVNLRSRKVVSRVVADEAIVVPIREGFAQASGVYTFNESGTTIWLMIESGRSAAEVAAYLESEYDISAEQAFEDTRQFLAALAEEGLIESA